MVRPTIPYGRQSIDSSDINSIIKVLKSNWLTQGSKVGEFEKDFAKFVGAKYAVGVSSGISALVSACFAAGIGKGDEVITTPYTFCATANSFVWFGANPVFVDIEANTLNIDVSKIEAVITKKTKAIITVDFAGLPCNYSEILKIAKKYNLIVIEDAAHALGSKFDEKMVGNICDMTCFSFHPVKIITTGEGGMITCNDEKYFGKLMRFRNHGISKDKRDLSKYDGDWYYEMLDLGLNFRLTDIQAALGVSQLKKISVFIDRRREIVEIYNNAFLNLPVKTPSEGKKDFAAWHLYPVRLELNRLKADRKKIFDELRKKRLGVQVHYIPVHLQPFYMKTFGLAEGDFPVAEKAYAAEISLPLFPSMTNVEIEYVVKIFKDVINRFRK